MRPRLPERRRIGGAQLEVAACRVFTRERRLVLAASMGRVVVAWSWGSAGRIVAGVGSGWMMRGGGRWGGRFVSRLKKREEEGGESIQRGRYRVVGKEKDTMQRRESTMAAIDKCEWEYGRGTEKRGDVENGSRRKRDRIGDTRIIWAFGEIDEAIVVPISRPLHTMESRILRIECCELGRWVHAYAKHAPRRRRGRYGIHCLQFRF